MSKYSVELRVDVSTWPPHTFLMVKGPDFYAGYGFTLLKTGRGRGK
jgi:hypothetical protein